MIRLRTLGPMELVGSDGQQLQTILAQPKRLALLAYLALATPRGVQRRDTLLALFWPEHDSEHARNSLSQSVHVLRRSLGADAIISSNAEVLSIDRNMLWCDAVAFEDGLADGRVADAVALYRGDLLDGFHVAGAPEFERWLEAERARLASRYAVALEKIATEREAAGDLMGAVGNWRRLAARDPFSSRIALRLMRALAALGDPAAAVRHARLHETLLREELHASPDAEIAAFAKELQSGVDHSEGSGVGRAREHGDVGGPNERRDTPTILARAGQETAMGGGPANPAVKRRHIPKLATALVVLVAIISNLALLVRAARRNSADSVAIRRQPFARPVSVPGELDPRAFYIKGQVAEISRSKAGVQTARMAYEHALRLDSTYALAYAGMAAVYGYLADYAYEPVGPMLDSARLMARRAVALDSTLPETHTALAVTLADGGQFELAEREFRQAIALGPNNARAHYWYSIFLVAMGRGDSALRYARRAAMLDPFAPRGVAAMQRYATYLIAGRHVEKQMSYAQRRPVLEREPGEPWAKAREAYDYADDGDCGRAMPAAARARELVPADNFRMLPMVGSVYWWCGERRHARALLDSMKRRPDAHDHGYRIAMMYTLFGERDSAFAWLPRHRWTMAELTSLRADRIVDSLRGDPRYPRLLRQLGLPARETP